VLWVDAVGTVCIIVPTYSSIPKGGQSENTSIDSKTTHHKPKHSRGKTQQPTTQGTVPAKASPTDAMCDKRLIQKRVVDEMQDSVKIDGKSITTYYSIQKCIIIK
jgi:hypothetical protein